LSKFSIIQLINKGDEKVADKVVIYERLWDCPACGTEDISALRKKKCPNCNHTKTSQDEERRTRIEVTDAEGLALAKGKENWTCSSCGSVNLNKHKECASCSNPKDESDPVNKVRKMTTPPPPVFSAKDEDKQFYEPEVVEEKVEKPNRTLPANADWTSQPMTAITEAVSNLDPTMIRNGIIAFFAIVLLGLLGYGIFIPKVLKGR
jgi:transcription elongation factor Elf1